MTTAAGTELPALLAHSAWVRRLAGCLVRDDALADDLTQETWLAALRHPPAAELPARPWLGQVMRNLVRMRARGERRRDAREQATMPADPAESPEQLVARAQAHQSLAALVVALAEPYRATVLLRFYEGLSAADIAARQGVPAGTVRWRLKTALAQLRTELDRSRQGDRRAWQLALAPLGAAPDALAARQGLSRWPPLQKGFLIKSLLPAAVVLVGLGGGILATRTKVAPAPTEAALPAVAPPPAPPMPPTKRALPQLDRQQRAQLLQRLVQSHRLPPAAPGTADPGELDKDYIRHQIATLMPMLKECYDNALAAQPTLHGKLMVAFTIVAEPGIGGLVSESAISDAQSTISDAEMRECVQETMYAAQFPAPRDGGEVHVTYPFTFATDK